MHAELKQVTGKKKITSTNTCIEAKDGSIIMDQDKVFSRWTEYISELYDGDKRENIPQIDINDSSPITESEVENALNHLPSGPDDIVAEILVATGEEGVVKLTILANMIYDNGSFPKELQDQSIFITLPKVCGTMKCEKHRTISLISHVTKLVTMIIIKRVIIKGRTLGEVGMEQYGFMPDKGTWNAIFVLRRFIERAIEKQTDIYACFIDYSKAFDTVKHGKLIEVLHNLDVDKKDIQLLGNLYWKQEAAVRINGEISEYMEIKQGVRQGCVASPHLFALYTEMIMRKIEGLI
jgi:hypothetical protein